MKPFGTKSIDPLTFIYKVYCKICEATRVIGVNPTTKASERLATREDQEVQAGLLSNIQSGTDNITKLTQTADVPHKYIGIPSLGISYKTDNQKLAVSKIYQDNIEILPPILDGSPSPIVNRPNGTDGATFIHNVIITASNEESANIKATLFRYDGNTYKEFDRYVITAGLTGFATGFGDMHTHDPAPVAYWDEAESRYGYALVEVYGSGSINNSFVVDLIVNHTPFVIQ
jgi:hypothetical protein